LNEFGFNNYVCGDLFAEGCAYPSYVQNMNVLTLPFQAETFDVVICNHLLEHVIEDLDAMRQIYQVLKFGGIAILQVPFSLNSDRTHEDRFITDPKEREKQFGQFDHVRIYGLDYFDRLKSAGFGIQRLNIFSEFSDNGLCKEEDIFLGSK
jgi:SAM-dependent methyltransferase